MLKRTTMSLASIWKFAALGVALLPFKYVNRCDDLLILLNNIQRLAKAVSV
jgi:hypothetical protein